MIYNVDIWEDIRANDQRSKQMFHARCRETGDEVLSHDPEHAMCRKLVARLASGAQMHTWRGDVPSMVFRSIRASAARCIRFESGGRESWRERPFTTKKASDFREAAE